MTPSRCLHARPERCTTRRLMVSLCGRAGVNIVGEVREPGYLEGGDYCPASSDLHFVVTILASAPVHPDEKGS